MKKKIAIIGFTVVILVILSFVGINKIVLERIYPTEFSEYVEKYSEKYNVEEEWVYALIKAESNFDKNSVSTSGAVGLMQLMEETANEMANNTRNKRNRFKVGRC